MASSRPKTSRLREPAALLAVFRNGPAAERSTATYPDDDARPLTAAGRKRVKASGRALRQAGFLPDRILFSPALRARETADILAKLFHAPEDSLRIEPALHGDADPAVLARRTLRLRTPGRTLWIGHEPGLGEMIGLLTGGPALPLRKAGIALLEMRGTRGPAVLKALVPPEWTSALR